MAQGDQVLAQRGDQQLIYNAGSIIYQGPMTPGPGGVLLPPPYDAVVREILADYMKKMKKIPEPPPPPAMSGSRAAGWIALAALVLTAIRSFYDQATTGCSSKNVNNMIATLAGAILKANVIVIEVAINALVTCMIKGLTPKAGSVVFIQSGTLDVRTSTGTLLGSAAVSSPARVSGAACVDNGIFATSGGTLIGNDSAVSVFTLARVLIGSVALTGTSEPTNGGLSSSQDAFFAGRYSFDGAKYVSTIRKVSDAAVNVQTWTLPNHGIAPFPNDTILHAFGVSWDGATLYYSARNQNGLGNKDLYQYDLVGAGGRSPFVADGTAFASGAVGLSNGHVATIWTTSSPASAALRVYTSAGALVCNTAIPYTSGRLIATRGEDDSTISVWSGATVYQMRVSDGEILKAAGATYDADIAKYFIARQPIVLS